MGGISPHFMEMGWFRTIFSSVGWKWCPGGPGVETPTKPMLFLCFLRVPGTGKCVSGWISTKNAVSCPFLVKIIKMGGIPRNSAIFTKFSTFGRSPPPGAAEGHGIYMYYKGFCRVRRGQEKVLVLHILPWNHVISQWIMILHKFSSFVVNFHEMAWKSWNWVYPRARAPK